MSARIECKGSYLDNQKVWFEYPAEYYPCLSETANPWIAAFVTKAMLMGQNLKVNAPASKQLMSNIKTFQDIYNVWSSDYKHIVVETLQNNEISLRQKYIGVFFSGGVDSFYTVLKNLNSDIPSEEMMSHSILIHGFDIPLSNPDFFDVAFNNIQKAADELGLNIITCKTNIKELLCPKWEGWGMCYGQLLVSVAMGIEKSLSKIYISSGRSYDFLDPRGSHVLTDPLLSTESLKVVHDGAEATRAQKILRQVAKSDIALKYLRVCYRNRFGMYNCGVCEKCIRTMVGLEVAGVLDKCETFESKLCYSDVANVKIPTDLEKKYVLENIDLAIQRNVDRRLICALRKSLRPWAKFRPRRILRFLFMNVLRPLDNNLLGGRLREFYKKRKFYKYFH